MAAPIGALASELHSRLVGDFPASLARIPRILKGTQSPRTRCTMRILTTGSCALSSPSSGTSRGSRTSTRSSRLARRSAEPRYGLPLFLAFVACDCRAVHRPSADLATHAGPRPLISATAGRLVHATMAGKPAAWPRPRGDRWTMPGTAQPPEPRERQPA